jgi:aminopeptidase N
VNGRPAAVVQDGEDIVITPQKPIHQDAHFRVVVAGYTATPTAVDPRDDASTAFFSTPDGTATAAQPNFAHLFLPSNDHPRDKASFTFHLDVPDGVTAVANGELVSKTSREPGRTVWSYDMRQPMATELVQIAAGDYDVTQRAAAGGVRIRDVTPRRLTAQLDPALATVSAHVPWMEDRVGRYPFGLYGSLVVDDIPFALETQTLSVFGLSWFTQLPQGVWEPTMVHELAHQWFGDSVAPYEWSDVWLNEGHATWYEITYAEEHGQLAEDTAGQFNDEGYADVESYMRAAYAAGDTYRAQYGPVAVPPDGTVSGLFNSNVYAGGALVLYALRQEIGPDAFAALERAWVTRYANGVAGTADFIALASKVAGRDLSEFLHAWLYDTTTPPMPGHPDWTVNPVEQQAQARALAPASRARRR